MEKENSRIGQPPKKKDTPQQHSQNRRLEKYR